MIRYLNEIVQKAKNLPLKKIAVAVAQDEPVLEAINEVKKQGIADAVLVGNRDKIIEIADKINVDITEFEIIHEPDNKKATLKAVELVSSHKADMLMKGLVDTATLLRSVLNKEIGLRTGKLISHIGVFEIEGMDRLLYITDPAFNTYPDLKAKVDIVNNAVRVAKAIGLDCPKVAAVAAVEVVNADMQATIDAAALAKMNDRGQITGCIVDGPFALDNAISEVAAAHKKVNSPVAGKADIILVPNIESGNIMYKTLTYLAESKNAALLMGASAPVIVTSRADSMETKVNSIALAALVAGLNN